ncbi:hypothetical protein AB6N30_04975 [Fusobacterium animalis]|nr:MULTISPECIES: hypothetical protein [Fusobacterium]EEO41758.2 hypothetical protein FSDG_00317 [Fusobacterium animalis 7_1]EHG18620.2 hypothetical protein HMPREF9369_01454 [Fusobacterium polymorphum F0401]EHO78598.1 hypothetical protein HMPREF9942_00669 [Fusobacterium animalis F0419]ERT40227.1 hypothetical protein HMPREF1538_01839 [Fusobacterium nucleatum CTI-1]KXA13205.1 hypothetical protein HMPREF3221_02420 [Fusobacterium nucleatum]
MEEKIIKDLKDIIMKLDQETINNLIKKSTSKEDKFFYNELYNLSLQMKQQKLIKEEKY